MATVGAYAQGAYATPIEGGALDASVVLGNDNTTRSKHNSHDSDPTIHVQSSTLASRPSAGTAQRVWVSTDGMRVYLDSGSQWDEIAYLPNAGGTVTGVAVFAGVTITAATVSSLTATSVRSPSKTGGIGYATGAGTIGTQAASKSTNVTINAVCGQIVTNNANLVAGSEVGFQVANTLVAASDVIILSLANNASYTNDAYAAVPGGVAASAFRVTLSNLTAGDLAEAVVMNFAVIKAVTS